MKTTRKEAREMRETIARWVQGETRLDEPRFARLRSGDMARCNDADRRPGSAVILIVVFGAFLMCGLIAGYAFGDVPTHYEPPRGYEPCNTVRC